MSPSLSKSPATMLFHHPVCSETPVPAVMFLKTPLSFLRKVTGIHSPANNQIQVAVVIEIRRPHAHFACTVPGDRRGVKRKIPFAVIDVQSVQVSIVPFRTDIPA